MTLPQWPAPIEHSPSFARISGPRAPRVLATLVSADRLYELRRQFPTLTLVCMRDASDIRRVIAGPRRGVLLIDPELLTGHYPPELSDDVLANGWQIIFDCRFSGSGARALLDRIVWQPGDVLVRPYDGTFITRVFDISENRNTTVELVRRLACRLQRLPPDTAVASIGVCLGAIPAQSCAEFALASGQSLRTLSRHMASAELGTPHRLIVVSRVVRSVQDLLNRKLTVDYVAGRWGFETARTLTRQVRAVTGQTPGNIRRTSPPMTDLIRSACEALTAAEFDEI